MARNGKLVIRPDSGIPEDILCGDSTAPEGTPQHKGVIQLLWEVFGGTVNTRGFRVLDSHVGAIYGDAITITTAEKIMNRLKAKGFATTNVVLGIGSYTYQLVTRDTYGMAMKATWVRVDNEPRDIFKSPVTDTGLKKSATGRLAVTRQNGALTLIERATPEQEASSLLELVFKDGYLHRVQNLDHIRRTVIG
jgi:nicotinamide phosphoribosyltransferase